MSEEPPFEARFRAAVERHQSGDLEGAEAAYLALLAERRDYAPLWSNFGILRRTQGHALAASAIQRRAVQLGGGAGARRNLLNALVSAHRIADPFDLDLIDPAGELAPDELGPEWRARTLSELGRNRRALRWYREAHEAGTLNPTLVTEYAIANLRAGRFREGWALYGSRWNAKQLSKPSIPAPEWQGEPLAGRRLLVAGEQGLGDMIYLARFLPLALAAGASEVSVIVRRPLAPLFESYGICTAVHARGELATLDPGSFDLWCNAFDLAAHLWPADDTPPPPLVPHPDADARAHAAQALAGTEGLFRVGVVWGTSPTSTFAERKSVRFERFLPFAEIAGVQLVSLMKGEGAEQVAEGGYGGFVVDAGPQDRHFLDTAALIEAVDLVITVDTAVAHLAGSMGRPVWTLVPEPPFWYWSGVGEAVPHYPSMRLIRQGRPGEWDDAFARIENDLHRMLS
jgi:tetratricopeptide (TPR) repeat protein